MPSRKGEPSSPITKRVTGGFLGKAFSRAPASNLPPLASDELWSLRNYLSQIDPELSKRLFPAQER
jgi:hypothetical protein